MATIKYTDVSPYLLEKRREHHTDYRYKRYLENLGPSSKTNANGIPRIHLALFGFGRAGSIHFANIISNFRFRLRYIVEADEQKRKFIHDEFDFSNMAVLTPQEQEVVFKDESIDAVLIATPTKSHEELVMKSLSAGKFVLCEKPVSEDVAGMLKCYQKSEEMGKDLICAFNRRFDPAFVEVRDQVLAGNVGKVHLIKITSRDSPLPSLFYLKTSGGILKDCAVHDIDIICWILGEFPNRVFAAASTFIPEIGEFGDYDTVAITLMFPSGAIGMIDISRNAVYGYDQRLEVFGPKGMITASNEKPMQVTFSGQNGLSQPPIYHSFPSRYEEGYKNELNFFGDVIQGKSENNISGDYVIKICRITIAVEESARTGQAVDIVN